MTENITKEKQERLNRQLFQLFEAIKNNDLYAIKAAVKAGINVNAKDRYGSPLLSRIMSADIKFLKYLLEAGADPDIQDSIGETALHKAVLYSNMNKVKLLLKYKADMCIKDKWGRTPFDLIFNYNKYDKAELFISAGYVPSEEDMQKIKDYRLIKAIEESDLSAVKAAITAGADINARYNDGNPLLLYTNITDIKIMKYLLENGASPNTRDNYKQSLLHKMSRKGNIDTIKVLLEFGADMTLKDKWGDTPFGLALHWEKYDIAELFVLNGYVPLDEDFNQIEDITEQEFLKARFTTLTVQMQEHKERLKEEAKVTSQEFAYADEIIEM